MPRPFELEPNELHEHLEEMVEATISDLGSEFLLMPKGNSFIEYTEFRNAYEVLKKHTKSFTVFSEKTVIDSLRENSMALGVLRAILGMTAPEWAELARSELESDITQSAARSIDKKCRDTTDYFSVMEKRFIDSLERNKSRGKGDIKPPKTLNRVADLVKVATEYITKGAPQDPDGMIHRLNKFDTSNGIKSLIYTAKENVPYAVLLYERYLGRPFASHRDAVSELVGEIMENAVEERLRDAGVTYRKTKRAERIPGFGQAPDFCIPDEIEPIAVIEAKITSDDGTARDKIARIKELETQRNSHVETGRSSYDVIACIDGRGFRERREDMRQILLRLNGKVFTAASLDHLITHTRIQELVST